jgi:hypothetical protein
VVACRPLHLKEEGDVQLRHNDTALSPVLQARLRRSLWKPS